METEQGTEAFLRRQSARTDRLMTVTAGLETLAARVEDALASSLADRAGLHQSTLAMSDQISRLTATATALAAEVDTLEVEARGAAVNADAAMTLARTDATMINQLAATTASTTAAQASTLTSMTGQVAGVATSLADLLVTVRDLQARRPRASAVVSVPALTVLTGQVDLDVVWSTPWPSAAYTTVPVLEAPTALLGQVGTRVKSQTASRATITVLTRAALTVGQVTLRAHSVD